MPQFHAVDRRLRRQDIRVGVVLFFGGLEKKLLITDPLAVLIAPYWQDASIGTHPAPLHAWAAARWLGYVMQLYFDFSGYGDVAIGADVRRHAGPEPRRAAQGLVPIEHWTGHAST
jgi:D-alanyl-lipoteichoic acid acyltransferase DltB (MBOAT superfamily)